MIVQLILGGVLVVLNITFHAIILDIIICHFPRISKISERYIKFAHRPLMSALSVLAVFLSHIIQIWLWAFVYLLSPELSLNDFHSALYFSTTTMTTLGFGDIVLKAPWNMLSAIEATNGFIAFGWSTAFTFEIISQLYRREAKFIQ